MSVNVTPASIGSALARLAQKTDALRERRNEVLTKGRDRVIAPEHRGHLAWLGERRANALVGLEEDRGSSLGMTVHVLDDDPMIRKAMRGERNSEATTN